MPAPINPPILAKASLVTARVIDKAADTPHAMTNAALAVGSSTHSVVGAMNQIAAENYHSLAPRGPAKLLERLFEKVDSAVISSATKGQRATEVFWVPFSDGVTQTGAAVANPFTLIYANKAGYTLPEDATEAAALLASIRHPEPYVRWPTAEPAEEPAPKVPDGGEGSPDAPKAPDGEGSPDAPKAPDGEGTPDAPKAPDGEGTPDAPDGEGSPDAPKAPDGEGTPDAPKAPDGEGTPDAPKAPDGEGTPDAPKAPDGEGTPDAPKAPDGDTPAPNGNEGTPGGEVPDAPKTPEGGGTDATIVEAPATNAGVTAGVAPEGSEAPVTAPPATAAADVAPTTAPVVAADAPVTTETAPVT